MNNEPKHCDCGRMGVKRVQSYWICQRCLDIEAVRARNERARYTLRTLQKAHEGEWVVTSKQVNEINRAFAAWCDRTGHPRFAWTGMRV